MQHWSKFCSPRKWLCLDWDICYRKKKCEPGSNIVLFEAQSFFGVDLFQKGFTEVSKRIHFKAVWSSPDVAELRGVFDELSTQ